LSISSAYFFGAVLTNAQQQTGRIRDVNCPVFCLLSLQIPADKVSRATEQVAKVVEEESSMDGRLYLAFHTRSCYATFSTIMELAKNEHYDHECQLLALKTTRKTT